MANEQDSVNEASEDKSLEDQWGEAFAEEAQNSNQETAGSTEGNAAVDAAAAQEDAGPAETAPEEKKLKAVPDAKPAPFGKLTEEKARGGGNLEMILDIPVTVSVELGKTRMVVNDLLQLGQGSVVELEKLAGEPMEIYVNNKLIARGEAVVVNEKFGVKLTDIVSPTERISNLK